MHIYIYTIHTYIHIKLYLNRFPSKSPKTLSFSCKKHLAQKLIHSSILFGNQTGRRDITELPGLLLHFHQEIHVIRIASDVHGTAPLAFCLVRSKGPSKELYIVYCLSSLQCKKCKKLFCVHMFPYVC